MFCGLPGNFFSMKSCMKTSILPVQNRVHSLSGLQSSNSLEINERKKILRNDLGVSGLHSWRRQRISIRRWIGSFTLIPILAFVFDSLSFYPFIQGIYDVLHWLTHTNNPENQTNTVLPLRETLSLSTLSPKMSELFLHFPWGGTLHRSITKLSTFSKKRVFVKEYRNYNLQAFQMQATWPDLRVFQERLRRWEEVIEKRFIQHFRWLHCVCRNVEALKLHNITGGQEERKRERSDICGIRRSLHEFLRVKKSKVSIRSSCIQYMLLNKRHLRIILKMKRDFLSFTEWRKENDGGMIESRMIGFSLHSLFIHRCGRRRHKKRGKHCIKWKWGRWKEKTVKTNQEWKRKCCKMLLNLSLPSPSPFTSSYLPHQQFFSFCCLWWDEKKAVSHTMLTTQHNSKQSTTLPSDDQEEREMKRNEMCRSGRRVKRLQMKLLMGKQTPIEKGENTHGWTGSIATPLLCPNYCWLLRCRPLPLLMFWYL